MGNDPNKTYEVISFQWYLPFYIAPPASVVRHETGFILKDASGGILFASPMCPFIPLNGPTCTNDIYNWPGTISSVRSMTFIHWTTQTVNAGSTTFYRLGLENLMVMVNELIYPPTPTPTNTPTATSTPTETPTPTATPNPCEIDVNDGQVDNQEGGLIWAINEANERGVPTTVCLSPYSIYVLDTSYTDFYGLTGLRPIIGNVTILGNDATIERDFYSNDAFRILGVDFGGVLTLEALTLQGGLLDTNGGGAIVNVGGEVHLHTVTITQNETTDSLAAEGGGGIYNYLGSLQIVDSVLTDNISATRGGAIFNWGDSGYGVVEITASIVENNTAPWGGGIFNNQGLVQINRSLVNYNYADAEGGGIYNYFGGLTITDWNEIIGNISGTQGGGIFNQGGFGLGASVITGSLIAYNEALSGGGVYNNEGLLQITQSVLRDNDADFGSGRAIVSNAATAVTWSCLLNETGDYGIAIENLIETPLDATNNWWGDEEGPLSGNGDWIDPSRVLYQPFVTEQPDCELPEPVPPTVPTLTPTYTPTLTPTDADTPTPTYTQTPTVTPTLTPTEECPEGTQSTGGGICVVPTLTPDPSTNTCMSRTITSIGVNLRPEPSFDSSPQLLQGGQVLIRGYFVQGADTWLQISGYDDGTGLDTNITGWIHLMVFAGLNPCNDANKTLDYLPIVDADGDIVVPTATPTPPPTQQPPGTAICQGFSANPFRIRSSPYYQDDNVIRQVDTGVLLDIYAHTQGGAVPNLDSLRWWHVSFQDGDNLTVGWMHDSVVDTTTEVIGLDQCVPEVVPTADITPIPPTPTLTPTPTNTPPPDLSYVFPLPMLSQDADGIPLSGNPPIRLTDYGCQFGGATVLSRDMNPRGVGGDIYPTSYHPVILPAPATIMVVDRDLESEDNSNSYLGVFVSVRILIQDIDPEVQARLEAMNFPFKQIDVSQGGSIHIGYAHLHPGSVPQELVPKISPKQAIELGLNPDNIDKLWPAGTIIGLSGASGDETITIPYIPHLDVSAFYVPDKRFPALPTMFSGNFPYLAPDGKPYGFNYDAYFAMYGATHFFGNVTDANPDGDTTIVNPLALWPSLQEGTGCRYEG